MSIIPCAENCKHQNEGYCSLKTAAAISNSTGGCPHFDSKKPQKASAVVSTSGKGLNSLPNGSDANNFNGTF